MNENHQDEKSDKPDAVDKSDVVDKSDAVDKVEVRGGRSLSRALLNQSSLQAGAVLVTIPWLLALIVSATAGTPSIDMVFWYGLVAIIPLLFISAFLFGASSLVYEALFLALPGRHERDLRWLSSWLREEGDDAGLFDASVEGRALFQLPCAGSSAVALLPPRASEDASAFEGQASTATLYVGPQRRGYRIQLQIRLSGPLLQRMEPCINPTQTMRDQWAPDLEPGLDVVPLPMAAFGSPVMRAPVLPEDLQGLDEDALWVSLHWKGLDEWARYKVSWRADDRVMVIERDASPDQLDRTLKEVRAVEAALWVLLAHAELPIHLQIATQLFGGLLEKEPSRLGRAWLPAPAAKIASWLPWWVILCERFHAEKEIQGQLSHFFLHADEPTQLALFAALSCETREAVLVPWLSAFATEGWRVALGKGLPVWGPGGEASLTRYSTEHLLSSACFDVWFRVLYKQLVDHEDVLDDEVPAREEALAALCVSILEGSLPEQGNPLLKVVLAARKAALLQWVLCDIPQAEVQIGHWLQTLDLPTKCALIRILDAEEKSFLQVEALLLPLLFVEKSRLTFDEREVCLATLQVAEGLATGPITAAIRQGLATWDPQTEAMVISWATHALKKAATGTMQGAMSVAEGGGEEGHLSLNDDSAEGGLSLPEAGLPLPGTHQANQAKKSNER